MTTRYTQTLFGPSVKAAQARNGSRAAYARHDEDQPAPDSLGDPEIAFLQGRDSLYMASVGNGGWPYLQHRGGPRGFLKVIDPQTVGFVDLRGNRQYVSVGNLTDDDRVALFLMDYPRRARLKILGHARYLQPDEAGDLAPLLSDGMPPGKVERFLLIRIEAFDWNCPQYITPRYTADEIEPVLASLKARIAELEARLAAAD